MSHAEYMGHAGYDGASFAVLSVDALFEPSGPTIRYANQAMANLVGMPRTELPGRSFGEFLESACPAGPRFPDSLLIEACAGRPWTGVLRRREEDEGAGPWFSAYPLRQPNGTVTGLIAFQVDLPAAGRPDDRAVSGRDTPRWRSEALFTRVLKNAADAIIVCDQNLRIIEFNTGAEEIFGYMEVEILDEPLERLIPERHRAHHDAHVRRFGTEPTTARHMSERGEISGLRRNGEEFPCEASIVRVDHEGEVVYAAIIRDLTDRKAWESTIRAALARAQEADAAKSRFLSTISHELRTPLNSVIGFSELALGDIRSGAAGQRCDMYLEHILSSGRQLFHIIEGILSVTEIDSRNLQAEVDEFDLITALLETVRALPDAAPRVNLVVADSITLLANRWGFCQIVYRLIENALKFSEAPLSVRVEAMTEPDGCVVITVRDGGVGIPEEHLGRLAEPFFQVEDSHTRRWGGLGLGLYIADQLARAHGGELELANNPDRGVTATARFPSNCVKHVRPVLAETEQKVG